MNILVLAPYLPSSSAMPGSSRTLELFRRLKVDHKLILAFPVYETDSQFDLSYLEEVFDVVSPKSLCRKSTFWSRFLHRLTLSPHFVTRYRFPSVFREMRQHVARLIAEHQIELIYVDQIAMTQYLPVRRSTRVVVDLCDSISVLFDQRVQAETRPRQKIALWIEATMIRRMEKQVINQSDRTIFISETDAQSLGLESGDSRICIIELGIDCNYFSFIDSDTGDSKNVIFVGAMDYLPNNDAALFLVEEVFPLLRGRDEELKIFIVGSNPSNEVRRLHDGNRIFVTGTVDDVRPYLRNASVFVSPLRLGVGVKHKIFIAMSMGVPIVATTLSVRGTDLVNRRHLILADTPEDLADAIWEVMENKQLAATLRENSFEVVQRRYDYKVGAEKIDQLLASL